MRTSHAGAVLMLCAAGLSACTEGPVAPLRDGLPVAPSIATCDGGQSAATRIDAGFDYTLSRVTVTGVFTGIPWNIFQSMHFPLGSGADGAACLNEASVNYGVTYTTEPMPEVVPPPAGVDLDFWNSLSPREQRKLLAMAEEYMRLYPGRYQTLGSIINNVFRERILRSKTGSKIRAMDYFGSSESAEQLAGAIYGCELYREFARDQTWIGSKDETLRMTIDLVTAFAEAQFAREPLRGIQFGRNGVYGAAIAAEYVGSLDCGTLAFNAVNDGRIRVTDPYAASGVPGGGGGTVPTQPPTPSLPPGWYDY